MTNRHEQFQGLGTKVELVAARSHQNRDDTSWEETVSKVQQLVERFENTFSRFRVDSELSRINGSPNRWVEISDEMWAVLRLSQMMYAKTEGIFHPCLGSWMESIGYDRGFEEVSRQSLERDLDIPNEEAPVELTRLPHQANLPFSLVENPYRTYLQAGYKFDLGGIAKGWIVEQAARLLQDLGWIDFIVSAGGDMVCSGDHQGVPWSVSIDNPFEPSKSLFSIDVRSACIATSGIGKRKWTRQSRTVHHIIDPRTGQSAQSDIFACTVVAPDLISAETYAKVVLILGSREGLQWLKTQQFYGFVIVKTSGEVLHSWG